MKVVILTIQLRKILNRIVSSKEILEQIKENNYKVINNSNKSLLLSMKMRIKIKNVSKIIKNKLLDKFNNKLIILLSKDKKINLNNKKNI